MKPGELFYVYRDYMGIGMTTSFACRVVSTDIPSDNVLYGPYKEICSRSIAMCVEDIDDIHCMVYCTQAGIITKFRKEFLYKILK